MRSSRSIQQAQGARTSHFTVGGILKHKIRRPMRSNTGETFCYTLALASNALITGPVSEINDLAALARSSHLCFAEHLIGLKPQARPQQPAPPCNHQVRQQGYKKPRKPRRDQGRGSGAGPRQITTRPRQDRHAQTCLPDDRQLQSFQARVDPSMVRIDPRQLRKARCTVRDVPGAGAPAGFARWQGS